MKFFSIFLIIFLACMFSLNNLYWYYQLSTRSEVQTNQDHNDNTEAENHFGSIKQTAESMFWALFGLGDPKYIKLNPFSNSLTEIFGEILYGFYHIASIIVLLNMLVASMTQSYEKILRESDIEWKFSRSKLYMEYIKEGATLPVPLNIIPTPTLFQNLFHKIKNLFNQKEAMPKQEEEMPPIRPARNSNMTAPNNNIDMKVMQRIVKRFLLHKQRESDEVGEADFEELKQDLQMVRYEMLNDLKRSREETLRLISHIHCGVVLLGDEIFKESDSETSNRFRDYKSTEYDLHDINNNIVDIASRIDINFSSSCSINNFGSNDSGFQSIKETTSKYPQNNKFSIGTEGKKLCSDGRGIDSLGSSTETQSSGELTTESIQINPFLSGEINAATTHSIATQITDIFENQKQDKPKINNELQIINEEEESENSIKENTNEKKSTIEIDFESNIKRNYS